mmetsp:Transcript_21097/g.42208  ORF Transcript_21097/g.42208 Transcript_21097/m.42208 type:complete len:399 (-) Transcript_21097:78-1274(-)
MMMSIAKHDVAVKASKMIIQRSCRRIVDRPPRRRQFSNKSSSQHSSAIEQVEAANNKKSSSSDSSSSTVVAAKDMLVSKLSNFTTQATQLAKTKANDAVTNVRASLHDTKVNAKVKSEQYAWEAHRSINKVTKEMETKIKSKAMDTKDKMKQSVEEATLSTKERIKDEVSKRMESFKLPSTLFGGGSKGNFASPSSGGGGAQTLTKSASTTSQQAVESTALKDAIPTNTTTNKIPSSQSKLSKLSSLLPNKETILSSATSSLLTKTVSNTTSNLSTQLQATIHKTFKWLWWWGLAAVGVYGMSTTLTKEGVKAIKDLVGGGVDGGDDKSSSSLTSSSVSKGSSGTTQDANAAVVVESDYVNGGFEVIEGNNTSKSNDDDKRANGGYLSWLSSWRRGWR